MKIQKSLSLAFGLVSLLSLNAFAAAPVPAEALRFRFMSNDGSIVQDCTHTLKDVVLNDWDVVCGARKFVIHFHLREYNHASGPHKTVEVAYYLSESAKKDGSNSSSQAFWLTTDEHSPIRGLVFHQSVDHDTADLVLGYHP